MKQILFALTLLLSATMCSKAPEGQKVLIQTSHGDIKVVLYDDTPLHRDNFIKLIEDGYYNDLTFHRIIKGFMIQGGKSSAKKDGTLNEEELIAAEIAPSQHIHKAGALAAARWGNDENPKKMSDRFQFYIVSGKPILDMDFETLNEERTEALKFEISQTIDIPQDVKDYIKTLYTSYGFVDWHKVDNAIADRVNEETEKRKGEILEYTQQQKDSYKAQGGAPFLDGEYTVFGEVYDGMDIVRKIEREETNAVDSPLKPVKIKNIQLM